MSQTKASLGKITLCHNRRNCTFNLVYTKQRLRLACASTQSDKSLLSTWGNLEFVTLVLLNKLDAMPIFSFEPIKLLDLDCWYKFTLICLKIAGQAANNIDLNNKQQSVSCDLGLHCLLQLHIMWRLLPLWKFVGGEYLSYHHVCLGI